MSKSESKKAKPSRVEQELEDLRLAIGLEPQPKRRPKDTRPVFYEPDPSDHLANQLNVLKMMFEQKKNDDYHANFNYASQRALFTMKTRRASEFGDVRIYTPQEMLHTIFAKSNVPSTIDWNELDI